MSAVTIIFPHQLFKEHPALGPDRKVVLIEETLFFNQYNFHRQKLLLHRASMKAYSDFLAEQQIDVTYVDATTKTADIRQLIIQLAKEKVDTIHVSDVADDWLRRRLLKSCAAVNINIVDYQTPNFLNTASALKSYFDNKPTYFQTDFYIAQRKQRNILLSADGKPEGCHWSYDADNRLKFPKQAVPPKIKFPEENDYALEAKSYIAKNFADNYGNADRCLYPTDFKSAEKWLNNFLNDRFEKFGIYEDAIVTNEHYLHHSILTPMLNIGLLSPQQIVDKALSIAVKKSIPLNSVEGFIRQIIGWREFIHIVYEREGRQQRTKNFWGFTRKIPKQFWTGHTGIFPVDNVIKKVIDTGYSHHIERLMVLGNFMLLCEFDPDDVYKWFMEMYVDSYDWVMVPNVYGMTQFADGGLMTTKPYISGSNYLLKMSDYPKGNWTNIWDALFWRFMDVHRDVLSKNQRLGMLIKTFDKWPADKRSQLIDNAEKYLSELDSGKTSIQQNRLF